MPSVTSTHGWIPIAEARQQLEAAGYVTEYTSGNSAIYVRKTPITMASVLRSQNGLVSPRSVKRLINRLR